MKNSEQLLLPFEPRDAPLTGGRWLGLQIDHRQFLDALQEEWLLPSPADGGRILAVASFAEEPKATSQQIATLISVRLRFELNSLPLLTVAVLSAGRWSQVRLDSLPSDAELVFWPGALPLFALAQITVGSAEERARLLGLVRQVSNVSLPDAAIEVDERRRPTHSDTVLPDVDVRGIEFTEEYGLVRGATTMAVWAIPRVDPWFDILVASFSGEGARLTSAAAEMAATWYVDAPWLPRSDSSRCDTFDCRLWRGALRAFLDLRGEGGIDAKAAVERVHHYAVGPRKSTDAAAATWRIQTLATLQGKEDVRLDDWRQCPVGKALQLLLLRPEPEHFAKWLQDLAGIPPAVWLSAATLCGYLHGYERLPTTFRGTFFSGEPWQLTHSTSRAATQ